MRDIAEIIQLELPVFRPVAVLAGLLLVALAAAAQTPDHDALRRLKSGDWPRAYFTGDTALLNSILADEFQRVGSDGEWSTKKEELAWVAANRPSYDSLIFQITRLDVLENGTAIVAGTGRIYSRPNGKAQVEEYQSTNVLIKRRGKWKAVASHTSGDRVVGER